jgi:hypothetical protein
MKANFKPLGLAAAVAAASAGYAGVANSQTTISTNDIGDAALVPYYTVQAGFGTGIHVINTSDRTQVVKFRFRRGSDSLDALDFNIVMSPYDEWTGFMNDTDGDMAVTTQDTTCTAPLFEDGRFGIPNIYRSGADEGYIEVIAMGSPEDEDMPLAYFAEHVDGTDGSVPRNCQFVEDNFLDATFGAALSPADPRGVHTNLASAGLWDADEDDDFFRYCPGADDEADGEADLCITEYEDGGDFLKVSWFIRDAAAGLEFGNDAVHLAGFSDDAMMTHQEQGVFSGNLRGFDFPNLNGSSPATSTAPFGIFAPWAPELEKYEEIRGTDVLGVTSVINDWSDNPDLNVGTDWIVTIPGQYVMLDQPLYGLTLGNPGGLDPSEQGGIIGGATDDEGETINCGSDYAQAGGSVELPECDWRDLPVVANFNVWDREENLAAPPPGDRDVVISPSIPGLPPTSTVLRHEVNVVHWSGTEVLASDYDEVDVSGLVSLVPGVSGWAKLNISSRGDVTGAPVQKICTWVPDYFDSSAQTLPGQALYDPNEPMECADADPAGKPPMIGFVAWQRSFPDNPDGNYGRAVEHSFESGSTNW